MYIETKKYERRVGMSATSIAINKNQLKYIASNAGQPFAPGTQLTFLDGETLKVSPSITNGAIYFATKDNTDTDTIQINGTDVTIGYNRAYIFLDDNDKRYAITGPVDWDEVLNKPLDDILSNITLDEKNLQLRSLNNVNAVKSLVALPFLFNDRDDTMTGHLTISQATSGLDNLTIKDETWPCIGLRATTQGGTMWIEIPSKDPYTSVSNTNLFIGNYTSAVRISSRGSIKLYPGSEIAAYQGSATDNTKSILFRGTADKAVQDENGNDIISTYFADASLSGRVLTFKYANNSAHSPTISLPFV